MNYKRNQPFTIDFLLFSSLISIDKRRRNKVRKRMMTQDANLLD